MKAMKARLILFAAIGGLFLLIASGCFGGGDDDASDSTTTTTSQAPAISVVSPPTVPVQPPTPTASPATTAPPVVTAAPPTTAAPLPSGPLSYTVVSGDTLASIATRFGSSVDAIVEASNLDSPDIISIGQVLIIPVDGATAATTTTASGGGSTGAGGTLSGSTYTVASGDTLAGIATRFDTSVDALVEANNLDSPDVISIGQTLTIP